MDTYRITDDNEVLWESSDFDAHEQGLVIMNAVENGDVEEYQPEIGTEWSGDLTLMHIIKVVR